MNLKGWTAFTALGLIWGSSFLWIKIAVQEVSPYLLVSTRLAFGLLGLLVVMVASRASLPRQPGILAAYLFMGVFNTALPFTLISWGETRIDSALAAILDGSVPLFTILIAHLWLHDEKISLPRIVGLAVGFVGVVVLVSRDLGPGALLGDVWGQAAVLLASICYALSATFARRHLQARRPLEQAIMIVLFAETLMWPLTLSLEPLRLPRLPLTWIALAWLGILGSCLAYLLYFYLIRNFGATRATLVAYLFPLIGLLLGIVFLDESADWRLMVGSALVLAGIVIVNQRQMPRVSPAPARLARRGE